MPIDKYHYAYDVGQHFISYAYYHRWYFIHAIVSKILASLPGDPWMLMHVKIIESDLPEILRHSASSYEVWNSSYSLASLTLIVTDATHRRCFQCLKLASHQQCMREQCCVCSSCNVKNVEIGLPSQ